MCVAKSQKLEIIYSFFTHVIHVDQCDSLKGLVQPHLKGIWECVEVVLVVMVTRTGKMLVALNASKGQ